MWFHKFLPFKEGYQLRVLNVKWWTCLNKLSGISFASVKPTLKNGHLMVKYMFRKIHSFFSTFFSPDVKTFWQKVVQNVQLFHFCLVFSSNSKTAFFSFLSFFFFFFFFGLSNILPMVKYRKWLWGTYGKDGKETDPGCLTQQRWPHRRFKVSNCLAEWF